MKCDNCGEVNPKACKICRRCRHKLRPSSCSSPSACSPLTTVTVRRIGDGWGVCFSVGAQHFDIGPQDYESEREAEWIATMFRNALKKANVELSGGEAVRSDDLLASGG